MEISKLNPEDIENMNYNELIGIVRETNRIPGGRKTILELMKNSLTNEKNKILEIGTSTGFTSLEISRLVKCKIISIDINEISLKEAKRRADEENYFNIDFVKADVNNLPFENEEFDMVIVGNVFSLLSNKSAALNECRRVCKKDGFLAAVPMYYLSKPPEELVKKVSEAIKVDITPLYKKDWMNLFDQDNLELFLEKDFKFDYKSDKDVGEFVEDILSRSHLKELSYKTLETLKKRYTEFMFLFRDNLSKMGYSILLLSNRRLWEDSELFTSKEI